MSRQPQNMASGTDHALFRNQEQMFCCPISDCNTKYNSSSGLRNHINEFHTYSANPNLQTTYSPQPLNHVPQRRTAAELPPFASGPSNTASGSLRPNHNRIPSSNPIPSSETSFQKPQCAAPASNIQAMDKGLGWPSTTEKFVRGLILQHRLFSPAQEKESHEKLQKMFQKFYNYVALYGSQSGTDREALFRNFTTKVYMLQEQMVREIDFPRMIPGGNNPQRQNLPGQMQGSPSMSVLPSPILSPRMINTLPPSSSAASTSNSINAHIANFMNLDLWKACDSKAQTSILCDLLRKSNDPDLAMRELALSYAQIRGQQVRGQGSPIQAPARAPERPSNRCASPVGQELMSSQEATPPMSPPRPVPAQIAMKHTIDLTIDDDDFEPQHVATPRQPINSLQEPTPTRGVPSPVLPSQLPGRGNGAVRTGQLHDESNIAPFKEPSNILPGPSSTTTPTSIKPTTESRQTGESSRTGQASIQSSASLIREETNPTKERASSKTPAPNPPFVDLKELLAAARRKRQLEMEAKKEEENKPKRVKTEPTS